MFSAPSPVPFPTSLPQGLEEVAPAAPGDLGAAFGFVLARAGEAEDPRPLAFAASRHWLNERGRPGVLGLEQRLSARRWLLVAAERDEEALWALEEALKSGAVAAGIAGVGQVPFVLSRRIGFAARTGKAAALLLRSQAPDDLSSASRRWRIGALPSVPDRLDPKAPGVPRLRAELVRRRDGPPGEWILEVDDETHRLRLAAGLADHGLVADSRTVAAA